MQDQIFIKWIRYIVDHVKPTAKDPALSLLDRHASHARNLEAISLAKGNHVVLLCFPPHCTHRWQPIDVGFMAPLRACYGQDIKSKSETVDAARLDEHIAKDRQTPPPSSSVAHETVNYEKAVNDDSLPGSSNSSFTVTPKDICPGKRKESKRKRGTSVELTSTLYKTKLEANQNSSVKRVKRNVKFGKGRPIKKLAKREFSMYRDSDSEENDSDDNPLCEVSHRFYSKSKKNEGWVQCRSCKTGCVCVQQVFV
ncbi:hypothetical protein ILUMI_00650 [Ignelater luminosus]|uniref:DDE-1 domain-containing protein n=1 Tax=Ignelater luminosus TaxID=2038154 RepID=A0A8K0DFV6_IGNLU|nr:hypothetical protein ILUMI_00650 [Ignelater luminosus]